MQRKQQLESSGSRAGVAARGQFSSPLIITGKRANADRIIALDRGAENLGLRPGLALAQARAMHPALVAVPEDPAADAQLLDAIAEWCGRYTPLVAIDPPDGIFLDIGGCAHLFGGEQALYDDLVGRLARFGFTVRASIADTIGTAWAVSRHGEIARVSSGAERELLAPLPVGALRLPPELVTVLARVGLKRIGDIIDLPRAPLAARFGHELLRQLDRALGREQEPLSPRFPVPPYSAEQRFAEPITHADEVLITIVRLANRLRPMLERRGEGARRIELCLFRTDGAVRRIEVGASRPLRDKDKIRALFAERLTALADELDPGFGFDLARLCVLSAEALPPEQTGFGTVEHAAEVDDLTDRLAARLGSHRVGRLVARDSYIPEHAGTIAPAQSKTARASSGWEEFRAFRTLAVLSPRPLRLLLRPELIEVPPHEVDTPPRRFQWRRALHEIVAAQGPERIEAPWWSDEEDGPARDYFCVEDRSGHRFWLFRAGLYRDAERARWFMHGLFA